MGALTFWHLALLSVCAAAVLVPVGFGIGYLVVRARRAARAGGGRDVR